MGSGPVVLLALSVLIFGVLVWAALSQLAREVAELRRELLAARLTVLAARLHRVEVVLGLRFEDPPKGPPTP